MGKKQGFLKNVGIEVEDNKAIRLFALIKKLYQRPEDDNESYEIKNSKDEVFENNIYRNNLDGKKKYKIPNIMHLVGTIFGTEDEQDNTTKIYFHETDNETSEIKFLKDKKYKRNLKFFGKFFMKEKNRNPTPFIINVSNKNNIIKKVDLNENKNNNLNENNKFNIENFNKINNINTNITNINNNLLTKEEDFSSNIILSEIKSEISKGGKNLIRFTNSSLENKEITNDEKDNNNLIKINHINNNDITNDNNENVNKNNIDINNNINEINNINNNINNDNINDNNNQNNNSKNNNEITTNMNKQPIPLISNISVTINQFFDKFKNEHKEQITDSERIKIDNNYKDNTDDNNNKNKEGKNENKIENKIENKYKIKHKKRIPLTKEEQNEINDNKSPINNIINIVVKNDNINNKNDEEDGIFFNKIINTNLQKNENK